MPMPKGYKHTAEARAKMSTSQRGRPKSAEHRIKIGEALRGKPKSAETRAKTSGERNHNFGKPPSAETRAKTSAALRGRPKSAEHRAKIGAALRGKKRSPLSVEHRVKLSAAHRGKHHPAETRNKMSMSQKRRLQNPAARAKISNTMLGSRNPNFGKHPSAATRLKISEAGHRRFQDPVERTKLSEANRGRTFSAKHRLNLSESQRGGNNHSWRGGISFEPYSTDWTRTLRRSIRERDRYTCRLCGKQQSDVAFAVHHADYDKKNCDPANLVTLCQSCHSKTNVNREYWTMVFGIAIEVQVRDKT